ncbi:hypothetical protein G7054_g954 [Neopestalotiopsis clavispora]|nr:hypothetical protein G7054_g954 [Neopestalotiopsis clavispora]
MTPYIYQDLESDEIRLLELLPGVADSNVEGVLHRFRLPEDAEPNEGHQVLLTREDGFQVPNAPKFRALSYTWGNNLSPCQKLLIRQGESNFELDIRPNLDGALRRLRREHSQAASLFLWIDAICINQSDLIEKNTQIPKMAMIYNRASGVCIWLGEGNDDSHRAICFIDELLNLDNFDPQTIDPGSPADWEALLRLMERPWFNRRWIVQEVALARQATLFCGRDSLSWLEFSAAVALLESRYHDLRHLFRSSNERHSDSLRQITALGAKTLVDLTNNVFRKSRDGAVLERLLSLEGLVTSMTAFQSTNPHDIIYAVLWLAHDAQPDADGSAAMSEEQLLQTPKDSPQLDAALSDEDFSDPGLDVGPREPKQINFRTPFPRARSPDRLGKPPTRPRSVERVGSWLRPPLPGLPTSFTGRSASDRSLRRAENHFEDYPDAINVDYNKPVTEVFTDFLEFAIRRSKTIDIICYPWAPDPAQGEPKLPSWICPLSRAPFNRASDQEAYIRASADPLVGYSGHGPRSYNASGRTRTYPNKGFFNDGAFTVTGFVLDTIENVEESAYEGTIPSTWLNLVDWVGGNDPVPDELWRTLVADRGLDGKRYPPAYFPLACKWVFSQRTQEGNIDCGEILRSGHCPSIATEFIQRVQSVVWDRRLVRTEGRRGANQLLVLVPEEARAGDLICILYGCSVPVVLRKVKPPGLSREASTGMTPTIEISSPGPSAENSQDPVPSIIVPDMDDSTLSDPVDQGSTASQSNTDAGLVDMGDTSLNQHQAGTLSVPVHPISIKGASTGVRRALIREDTDKRPPNLVVSSESRYRCEIIGACFVHGMMDGEAFKHRREYGLKLRTFYLV